MNQETLLETINEIKNAVRLSIKKSGKRVRYDSNGYYGLLRSLAAVNNIKMNTHISVAAEYLGVTVQQVQMQALDLLYQWHQTNCLNIPLAFKLNSIHDPKPTLKEPKRYI